ncbi:MAG: sulfatase-like hydrolase/transferase [Verrucomicrobiota bacterium]|nr:sulfatase-like hydrolase/transferase [Verrucomicrobiota bacterium]MEC7639327.1 sulfatase-like hydrolase/transferase [Verrucomicrobiota bacterium]
MDKLASEGIRFFNAHVNISICTPSRSLMLTGLYPQNN